MDRSGSVASSAELVPPSLSPMPEENPPVMAFVTRLKDALSIVTVEPVLFFYMLATFMQYSVFQDLVYQKTCHNNFNNTICHNLNNNTEALDIVQAQASHWILGSTAALTIPSIIVANYLGS